MSARCERAGHGLQLLARSRARPKSGCFQTTAPGEPVIGDATEPDRSRRGARRSGRGGAPPGVDRGIGAIVYVSPIISSTERRCRLQEAGASVPTRSAPADERFSPAAGPVVGSGQFQDARSQLGTK